MEGGPDEGGECLVPLEDTEEGSEEYGHADEEEL